MTKSLEEIAIFLRKSRLLVLHSRSPLIQGLRFLRTLLNLSGACLLTQLRNNSFHSCHMPFGPKYKSTLAHCVWLRSRARFIAVVVGLRCQKTDITMEWSLIPRWMTPDLVTFSGVFVMHKSIKILETENSSKGQAGNVVLWGLLIWTNRHSNSSLFLKIVTYSIV